jgi:hypothetical protein
MAPSWRPQNIGAQKISSLPISGSRAGLGLAEGRIDFADRCPDTGTMGVRIRGLDIKAGAAKLKADRAARIEAELVIDRWNRRLATGRDMLWSPTIRAALVARMPWLAAPLCGTSRAIDFRTSTGPPSPPSARWCLAAPSVRRGTDVHCKALRPFDDHWNAIDPQ